MKVVEKHIPIPSHIRTMPELVLYLARLQHKGHYADLGSAEGISNTTPSIRLLVMEEG